MRRAPRVQLAGINPETRKVHDNGCHAATPGP